MAGNPNPKTEQLKKYGTDKEPTREAIKGGIASGIARRKKKSLTEILKIMLEEGLVEADIDVKQKDGSKKTERVKITPELLHGNIIRKAAKGDNKAWELLMNRAEGMPEQKTDLTTKGESINFGIKDLLNEKVEKDK